MKKGIPYPFRNKQKYKIVHLDEEEPYVHNGIVMLFRTKLAANRLLHELDTIYGKEEFSIRRYHE